MSRVPFLVLRHSPGKTVVAVLRDRCPLRRLQKPVLSVVHVPRCLSQAAVIIVGVTVRLADGHTGQFIDINKKAPHYYRIS